MTQIIFWEKAMKMKFFILAAIMFVNGCAWVKADKTPLSPHGELNVCLRDRMNSLKKDENFASWDKTAVIHKTASYCLDKLKMTDAFSQNMAYRNADYLLSESDGISLK